MKTKNTTTTKNETPIIGDAFREVEVPLKQTPAPLPDWMEWVEDRPIVCGLIAAVIGIVGGLIVGANI